ncbi:phage tail tape measure protein [Streptomyces sp. NPDC057509]|uniref:phage tail tape measure protein n=1 Tax=Streptomyces sp. NPDC057509 TaxID=3346152 RepID=UPI0036A9DB0C
MPRAGAVWVDVLPNMSNFGRQLQREIGEPVAQASARAGDDGGESLLSSMKAKVAAGALAVGAVAGALLTKGLETSLEKGKAAATLKGQLSISAADAKKAGEVAGKLWSSSVTESVEEGAEAVKLVLGTGLVDSKASTKEIGKISTAVSDLATLFDQDITMAAKAAASMVNSGFAKTGTEAVDAMTYGFQNLGVKAEDLAETFNEYSPFLKNFGLNAKDALGLMSQGLEAGAWDTDKIGDSFKELYLRITGGADSVKDALKSIGLGGSGVMKAIENGGPGARKALDQVLDALRKVPDEGDKARAVQDLFGGPGEDLGAAIFSLNVDTASKKIGNFAGAAKKAGDDLRSDVGTSFETFKRKALMAIGDGVSKYVLPKLMTFGRYLHSDVLPVVQRFGGVVDTKVVPAVKGFGSALASGARWVKEYGVWFAPLAIAIGGVTLAMSANAIATSFSLGVLGAYSIGVRGVMAVTRAWTAAQALFNSVMALNPITLIVIGVLALAAAAYIAFKKVGWFHDGVMAAWSGIKTGWDWLWTKALKPGFGYFMVGLRAVGAAAMWLWSTVIKPVFSFISTAAKVLFTAVVVIVLIPLIATFKVLAAVAIWTWHAISPAFDAIGAAAVWLWSSVIKPVFGFIVGQVKNVGATAVWLWTSVVKPVFGWIADRAKWLWTNSIKPTWELVKIGTNYLGTKFREFWTGVIKPVFGWIADRAKWLWEKGLKPAFDLGKKGVAAFGDAFTAAKKVIGEQWGKLKSITKKPIEFVINTVYNKGIRKVWNEVAGAFGAPRLPEFKGFARGGVLPGQSSWRGGDDQLVPMRRGEGVYVSEAMRDPYERARLHAVNKAAMQGRSLSPFRGEGFSKGGIFGWVKSTASKGVDLAKSGVDWLKDGVKASAEAGLNKIVKPLISRISGSDSAYRDMITGIPKRMIKTIIGYSGKADGELEKAGIGSGGFKAGLRWAKTQVGKAYQWGGNGDPSWDCSGFVSAIESVIRGERPHRRWATGAFSGAQAPPGWKLGARSPYMIGITNSGVGHTAGTLNGTNVESRGGSGVLVGSRARSYMDPLFTHRYGYTGKYDQGGFLPTGWSSVYNGTGKPEPVMTSEQFGAMAGTARVGAQVVESMAAASSAVEAAVDRLAVAVGPARVVPVTSGRTGGGQEGALRRGDTVVLRIGESEFEAVVDRRVDNGLSDVRRTLRAGKKR